MDMELKRRISNPIFQMKNKRMSQGRITFESPDIDFSERNHCKTPLLSKKSNLNNNKTE